MEELSSTVDDLEIDGGLPSLANDHILNARPEPLITPASENETKRKRNDSDSSEGKCVPRQTVDDGERYSSHGSDTTSSSSASSSLESPVGDHDSKDTCTLKKLDTDAKETVSELIEEAKASVKNIVGNDRASDVFLDIAGEVKSKVKVEDDAVPQQVSSIQITSDRAQFIGEATTNENKPKEHAGDIELNEGDFDPLANSTGNFEITEYQDEDGDTLLHLAIILKDRQIVLKLIGLIQNQRILNTMNDLFQTPLHLAVLVTQEEDCFGTIVSKLLAAHACIHLRDGKGRTPLHIACETGQQALLDVMLGCQWDCQYIDERLSVSHPTDICTLAKSQFLDTPNSDGKSCLHIAVNNNDLETVEMLLRHGADVNYPDVKSGRTALHFAVEMGNLDMVKLLIDSRQADIDQKTRNDETAWAIAYHRKEMKIASVLEKHGARVDYKYLAKFGVVAAEIRKRCKVVRPDCKDSI